MLARLLYLCIIYGMKKNEQIILSRYIINNNTVELDLGFETDKLYLFSNKDLITFCINLAKINSIYCKDDEYTLIQFSKNEKMFFDFKTKHFNNDRNTIFLPNYVAYKIIKLIGINKKLFNENLFIFDKKCDYLKLKNEINLRLRNYFYSTSLLSLELNIEQKDIDSFLSTKSYNDVSLCMMNKISKVLNTKLSCNQHIQ